MNDSIFSREELLKNTGISGEQLLEWEEAKLISPFRHSDSEAPYYGREHLDRIVQMEKLRELGYGREEVQKIIRKVGLPADGGRGSRPSRGPEFLTVGMLAEKIGTSPRTIKHWEEKGIIEPDMRSEGGFRLFNPYYVFFGELIKDLQLFGYSLEEIKTISDYFRDFIFVKDHIETMDPELSGQKLSSMTEEIRALLEKIELLKKGISRWEELVKKNRKEIQSLLSRSQKLKEKQEKEK